MTDTIDKIQQLTGLDDADRKKLKEWIAKQPDAMWLELEDVRFKVKDLLNKKKKELQIELSRKEFFCAVQFLSLHKMYNVHEKGIYSRNPEQDQVKDLVKTKYKKLKEELLADKRKKRNPAYLRIKELFGTIQALIEEEGASWREVERYMHKYHKLTVTYAHLNKTYNQLKKDQALQSQLLTELKEGDD